MDITGHELTGHISCDYPQSGLDEQAVIKQLALIMYAHKISRVDVWWNPQEWARLRDEERADIKSGAQGN